MTFQVKKPKIFRSFFSQTFHMESPNYHPRTPMVGLHLSENKEELKVTEKNWTARIFCGDKQWGVRRVLFCSCAQLFLFSIIHSRWELFSVFITSELLSLGPLAPTFVDILANICMLLANWFRFHPPLLVQVCPLVMYAFNWFVYQSTCICDICAGIWDVKYTADPQRSEVIVVGYNKCCHRTKRLAILRCYTLSSII